MIFLAISVVVLLLFALKVILTINKIKTLRQNGIDLRKKNSFYKWVSNTFLNDMPL